MSQIYKAGSGTPPPSTEVTIVTDDGTVISMSDIINFNGVDSTEDNANGILIRANPNNSNNMLTVITNRLVGTGTTVGNVTDDVVTFGLGAAPAVYRITFDVAGIAGSGDGVGYFLSGTAKTDGATATVIASPFIDDDEDSSLEPEAGITLIASGNNVILQVTGVTGQTINYNAVGTYVKVV